MRIPQTAIRCVDGWHSLNSHFCQTEHFRVVTSNITNRRITLNTDEKRFLIPEQFQPGAAAEAVKLFEDYYERKQFSAKLRIPDWRRFRKLIDIKTKSDFALAIDDLIQNKAGMVQREGRVVDLLVILRLVNCLVWPRSCYHAMGQLKLALSIDALQNG